ILAGAQAARRTSPLSKGRTSRAIMPSSSPRSASRLRYKVFPYRWCCRRAADGPVGAGGSVRARTAEAKDRPGRTMQKSALPEVRRPLGVVPEATFSIVLTLSFAHLLNDMMQSLLPAMYPMIKEAYGLDFGQIGLITLAFQLTASLLQPVVGMFTDRRPQPFSLVAGMALTLIGLIVLGRAGNYPMLLIGAALIGTGSSIFHPEATRMARVASGGGHGFAQSLFQVGGQTGPALGPPLAAVLLVPRGQTSISSFSLVALVAMVLLLQVGQWYKRQSPAPAKARLAGGARLGSSRSSVALALAVLVLLMFSKNAYTASLSSYYTFYLIDRF